MSFWRLCFLVIAVSLVGTVMATEVVCVDDVMSLSGEDGGGVGIEVGVDVSVDVNVVSGVSPSSSSSFTYALRFL